MLLVAFYKVSLRRHFIPSLTLSASSIIAEDIVIAYIMLGRFRDKERFYSSIKKVNEFSKNNELDVQAQKNAYYKLPIFSQDVIRSSFNVLKSLICYIGTENLISTHKDLLPQKIENYINQNLTSNILSVDHTCKTFFISKRSLYEIFHKEFQDTFCNYVLKKRLQMAKKILLTSKLSITEISERCGFADYNYFSRAFTKKYGISPSRLRKENTHKTNSPI